MENIEPVDYYGFKNQVKKNIQDLKSKYIYFTILFLTVFTFSYFQQLRSPLFYSYSIRFTLEQNNNNGLSSIASQFGLSSNSSDGLSGENLLELFNSHMIIKQALINLEGHKNPNKNDDKSKVYDKNLFTFEDSHLSKEVDSSLSYQIDNHIIKHLNVAKRDRKLNVVELTFQHKDKILVKEFPNELLKVVSDFYVKNKNKNMKENIVDLELRIDSVEREISKTMYYMAQNENINSFNIDKNQEVINQKNAIQISLLTSLYAELVKNKEINKTILNRETPVITIIDKENFPEKMTKAPLRTSLFLSAAVLMIVGIVYLGYVNFFHPPQS